MTRNKIQADKPEMETLSYRNATPADIPLIRQLFKDTVLTVNRKDYTDEETADWASCGDSTSHWKELVNSLYFIIATCPDGSLAGFAAIRADGYLHSMYVHKDRQRLGVASRLLDIMETHARLNGLTEITADVSITARPFFEKKGYTVKKEQKAKANRLYMTNYKMHKTLLPTINQQQ